MALTKTYTKTENLFNGALEIPNAYWKVESVTSTKTDSSCVVSISKILEDNQTAIETKQYKFATDMQGDNPIRQAYKHLKTLPEFAGATDC
jgi:hypothetical protein